VLPISWSRPPLPEPYARPAAVLGDELDAGGLRCHECHLESFREPCRAAARMDFERPLVDPDPRNSLQKFCGFDENRLRDGFYRFLFRLGVDAFATSTRARAREADDGGRTKTCGRLAAWAGLDLGDDIAGEVLRCPAQGAERVECWVILF
jgi:hypothetical protein